MSISIERTALDSRYHGSQSAGSNNYGFYVFHNVDVFNEIKIGNQTFLAMYQQGCSYKGNDYSCPSDVLELSLDGGADELLLKIWRAGDFDSDSDVSEFIEDIKEDYDLFLSLEDLRAVYSALTLNQQDAERELQNLDLSDDLNDYIEDEESGLLKLETVSENEA